MEIIINLVEASIICFFINTILTPKFSKIPTIISAFAFIVIFASGVYAINKLVDFETLASISYFIVTILYALGFFKGKSYRKIFLAVLSICIVMLSSIITSTIMPLILNVSFENTLELNHKIRIYSLIFAKSTQIILTALVLVVCKKSFLDMTRMEWVLFAFLFVFSYIIEIAVFKLNFALSGGINLNILLIVTICLVLINVFTFIFYYKYSRKKFQIVELEYTEKKLQAEIDSAESVSAIYVELRKARHNLLGQFSFLNEFIGRKKYEEAEKYLAELTNEIHNKMKENVYVYTGSYIIDSALNNYIRKCNEKNIEFVYEIGSVKYDGITNHDISILLYNILNNAVEASCKIKEPMICLKIVNYRNYIKIYCENNFDGEINSLNGKIITSKNDKKSHGFGLMTIRELVKNYNGVVEINYDKKVFSVNLIIPLAIGEDI